MRLDSLSNDQHGLYFDVLRSVRYHEHRSVFYDRLHKSTNALTILTSGIALVDLSGEHIPRILIWVVAFTAILATCDLVIGYGRMADLHRTLRRRFCILETQLVSEFPKQKDVKHLELERLSIQQDEPAVFRALDIQCHNEILQALGYHPGDAASGYVRLPWWKAATAQWWLWPTPVLIKQPDVRNTRPNDS